MRVLALTAALAISTFFAETTHADASDGELFGYALGKQYTEQDDESQTGGQLSLIEAKDPVKPKSIDKVFVLLTPVSHSIGRIAGETWYASGEDAIVAYERFRVILREKYSAWESEERTEQNIHASRFSDGVHELNLHVSGPHGDDTAPSASHVFRFLLTLSYLPSTEKAMAFDALAKKEMQQSATGKYSQDDLKGL